MPEIAYFAPLEKAFGRMKTILFSPFKFTKWLVLGFTAWLAHLCEGGPGNFNPSGSSREKVGVPDLPGIIDIIDKIGAQESALNIIVAVVVFVVALALVLLVIWINSRGKFIFLDNVVHDRYEVKKPWRDFKKQGNSLFCWGVVFVFIFFAVILIVFGMTMVIMKAGIKYEGLNALVIAGGVFAGLLFLVIITVATCLWLFLVDFIVPIMYKNDLKTMEAWRMFMPVFREYFWKFVLWILFRILIGIGVVVIAIIAIIITCCIAGCLLILPYVGAVFLLPITVTIRSLSIEFIRQFSPDFDVFPPQPPPAQEVMQMPPLMGPPIPGQPQRAL